MSRLGIPRTDVLFGEERLARTREAVRRRYGLTDGRRVILYAPTFRGDSVTDAHATDDLDLGVLREALGEDHVLLVRLHPFVRSAHGDRPGARGLRDRRLGPPRHQRADARQRRPRDRLLERDLRVRAARPADGLLRPGLRGLRAERGFYFDYRTGVPGPIFETSEALAAYLRAGDFDLERVERFRAGIVRRRRWTSTARVTDELIVPALSRAGRRALDRPTTVLRGLGVPYRGPPSPAPVPAM